MTNWTRQSQPAMDKAVHFHLENLQKIRSVVDQKKIARGLPLNISTPRYVKDKIPLETPKILWI